MPEPLSPTSPTLSPAAITIEKLFSPMVPSSKRLTRSRTSSSGGVPFAGTARGNAGTDASRFSSPVTRSSTRDVAVGDAATSRFVYGCCGERNSVSASACSTSLPCSITTTRRQ